MTFIEFFSFFLYLFIYEREKNKRNRKDKIKEIEKRKKSYTLQDKLLFELQAISQLDLSLLFSTLAEFIQTMLMNAGDNMANPAQPLKHWLAEV